MTQQKDDASDDELLADDGITSLEEMQASQSGMSSERVVKEVVSGDFIVASVPSLRGEGKKYVAKVRTVADNGFGVIFMVSGKRSTVFFPEWRMRNSY